MEKLTESQIQAKIIKWFWNDYKEFRGLLYHNFNNPRNAVNGAQLIALGLMKGNPDLTLAIPRCGYGSLYIELKKPGKKPEDHQVKQMNRLKEAGNLVTWSDDVEEVKTLISEYLNGIVRLNKLRKFD